MQTFTKGGMENLFQCIRILSLLCCIFCISSTEERHPVFKVEGSSVKLHCKNNSLNTLTQLSWKRNGNPLLSFEPPTSMHHFDEALSLNINMSVSKNELYALMIESVQMDHEGNYTCEITSPSGVCKKKWKLIIIENKQAAKLDMTIMIPVISGFSLAVIMILAMIIRKRVCKKSPQNIVTQSPIAEEQTEEIYENCLEMNIRARNMYNQQLQYNTMTHSCVSICRK